MEEIKIGDYVRINKDPRIICLGIGKVVNKVKETIYAEMGIGLPVAYNIDKIVKHNKNIIELVEVGDYVNGYKVVEIDEYKPIGDVLQKYLKVDCSRLLNAIYSEQIKTILTKEQMEANCYRLEV